MKTKLATGEMPEVFNYNSGSLFQAINPDQNLVPLTDEPWVADLSEDFKCVVSTDQGLYGAPTGTTQAGGVLYNKKVYDELGLKVPTSWAEFKANNDKIKADGKVDPIQQTYGDTWTSQLFVLGDFANVAAQDPEWADAVHRQQAQVRRPAGPAELQEPAGGLRRRLLQQELRLGEVRRRGQGRRHRHGGALPDADQRLSTINQNFKDNVDDVGFFALPAQDAADTR